MNEKNNTQNVVVRTVMTEKNSRRNIPVMIEKNSIRNAAVMSEKNNIIKYAIVMNVMKEKNNAIANQYVIL
jgi:hypothetical protein